MIRRITVRVLLIVGMLSLIVLVGANQPAMALNGPVQSLPLGVNVGDSETLPPEHPDYGEQWGRDGGRTMTFTIFQVSEYDPLEWRPVNVGIAFDGAIDAASETLTYTNIEGGKAVWLGNTQVEVLNESTSIYESQTVNTRFILTVKDAGDSLVTFEFVGSMPVVNLTTLTPNPSDEVLFAATLEMEVQMPSYDSVTAICPYAAPVVGEYLPALDVFDCLQTNPAYDRPAITRFEYAFFYELSELPTLGLAGHDEHMDELVSDVQTTVNNIHTWTEFLYDDWVRISGLNVGQMEIKENTAVLGGTLNNVFTTVGEINAKFNMLEEIDESVDKIPDFLLLLFGLEDFIQDEELKAFVPLIIASSPLYQAIDSRASQASMDSVEAKLDALQSVVETLQTSISDTGQIAVEAIEVRSQQRYLLSTVIGGLPVNVDLVSVLVVSVGQNKPITVTDVTGYATGTLVATGLLEVTLDLPKKMTDGDILRVTVTDANGYSGTVMVPG